MLTEASNRALGNNYLILESSLQRWGKWAYIKACFDY
jgi:hypothetical protein